MIAIDPGLRGCGVAVFHDGKIAQAGYIRGAKTGRGPAVWSVMAQAVRNEVFMWEPENTPLAIERPQVYTVGKSKGDPDDLLELTGVVGAICYAHGGPVTAYRPREWKGQLPKEIHHNRIRKHLAAEGRLEATERLLAGVPPSLAHNVWDAIGLGRFALSRGAAT